VFEIIKTPGDYASTPPTLVSFDYIDGARPEGSLTVDAHGDLFGTSETGGGSDRGPLFKDCEDTSGFAGTADQL
jgi:hypothetical protein